MLITYTVIYRIIGAPRINGATILAAHPIQIEIISGAPVLTARRQLEPLR